MDYRSIKRSFDTTREKLGQIEVSIIPNEKEKVGTYIKQKKGEITIFNDVDEIPFVLSARFGNMSYKEAKKNIKKYRRAITKNNERRLTTQLPFLSLWTNIHGEILALA